MSRHHHDRIPSGWEDLAWLPILVAGLLAQFILWHVRIEWVW